jgi:hypothetical protein
LFKGSADASDATLVANRLAAFTVPILTRLKADRTTVVVCRGSVTEYLTQLRGIAPRGWPPGSTWDLVPGTFYPESNEVVLAVIGPPGYSHIPAKGEGHGSEDVVLHETAHGLDMGGGLPYPSSDEAFKAARDPDFGLLTGYEKQPSPAGEQETFAESAARFFTGRGPKLPHLDAYWASISDHLARHMRVMAALPIASRRVKSGEVIGDTIGTASMSLDGTIALYLRATGSGAKGDALLTYQRSDPRYDDIMRHLAGLIPNEIKHIPPFSEQH